MKKFYFSSKEEAIEAIKEFANSNDLKDCNKASLRTEAGEISENVVIRFTATVCEWDEEEIISEKEIVVNNDNFKTACAIAHLLTCDLEESYVTKETRVLQTEGEDATIAICYLLSKYEEYELHIDNDMCGKEAIIRECVNSIKNMSIFEIAKCFANVETSIK